MVKHIVFWKLHENANGKTASQNAEEAKRVLEALNGKIPGLKKLEVGMDFSNTDNSAHLCLYSELESKEALEVYRVHPDHQAVFPLIREITCERRVCDYEI